ncbi:MAG TPA: Mur ligase domain-containing protein [Turneriella sp.]|nr:Mur ligase domain-containing protein [Turneriella sp.]
MVPKNIHIIGAGGVGMSGLALLARRMGAVVTASDQSDSPYLRKLAEKGITTWVGSQPERMPASAHVFYSTAIKPEDSERTHAERSGMPCESRHQLLNLITRNYFTIAIAGCHGKTTTSAWTARLLERAGFDPTALIGGTVPEWNSNYREGHGTMQGKPLLVIEADESDRSFLSIDTNVAMVTNIDLDHTDVHASLEALTLDFLGFLAVAQAQGGWIHLSKECPQLLQEQLSKQDQAIWINIAVDTVAHAVIYENKKYPVGLAGTHNLLNATLVLQLALKLGIDHEILADTLREFGGVNRRMQTIATFPEKKLVVIDDYAHHPHEVEATLSALAARYDRLLIFWEPHRLSRFNHFFAEFDAVLRRYASGHALFVLPIFASGDKLDEYPQTEERFAFFKNQPYVYVGDLAGYEQTAGEWTGSNNAAVFMGAGKSSEYAHAYAHWLQAET